MVNPHQVLTPTDALLVVDVQKDFCPGGALPIPQGHEVVPVLNRWIEAAAAVGAPVFASRDWHPPHHVSFAASGGEWPAHCLQQSEGARFHPDLRLPDSATVVSKGARVDRDQYSAFEGTGLAEELRRLGVRHVWVGGLAQDVCVRATILDARHEGFEATLIADATRPVMPAGGDKTIEDIRRAGARVETTA